MSTKIELDRVSLSTTAVAGWLALADQIATAIVEMGISPTSVGVEEAWLKEDGSLEIRLQAGPLKATMDVPPEHWHWRQNN